MKMNQALLIIDLQNDYFEGGANPLPGAEEAARNAALLLNRFRTASLPVIHVKHISIRPGSTFFLPGSKGAEIHDTVRPVEGEPIVTKHFPNSFRETDLLDELKAMEINNLVVCGMMTHVCVDSTVRAAKDFGFEIILAGDACATKSLEIHGEKIAAGEVHNSFLAAMNYFYTKVMKTEEIGI